jgi:hypothetical protein
MDKTVTISDSAMADFTDLGSAFGKASPPGYRACADLNLGPAMDDLHTTGARPPTVRV